MIKNVFDGSADLIGAPLSLSASRAEFVHYLPVLTNDRFAVFIKIEHKEKITLATFVNPFAADLWVVIHLVATIFALFAFLTTSKSKVFRLMTLTLTTKPRT